MCIYLHPYFISFYLNKHHIWAFLHVKTKIQLFSNHHIFIFIQGQNGHFCACVNLRIFTWTIFMIFIGYFDAYGNEIHDDICMHKEIQRNEEEIIQVQDHGGPHPLT